MSLSFSLHSDHKARHFVSATSEGPTTCDSDLDLNEPCSKLVSTIFVSVDANIFNLPVAEERGLAVIPHCAKSY